MFHIFVGYILSDSGYFILFFLDFYAHFLTFILQLYVLFLEPRTLRVLCCLTSLLGNQPFLGFRQLLPQLLLLALGVLPALLQLLVVLSLYIPLQAVP
jgi:hypothetical protein